MPRVFTLQNLLLCNTTTAAIFGLLSLFFPTAALKLFFGKRFVESEWAAAQLRILTDTTNYVGLFIFTLFPILLYVAVCGTKEQQTKLAKLVLLYEVCGLLLDTRMLLTGSTTFLPMLEGVLGIRCCLILGYSFCLYRGASPYQPLNNARSMRGK